jgi:hypothetical protein
VPSSPFGLITLFHVSVQAQRSWIDSPATDRSWLTGNPEVEARTVRSTLGGLWET